jgi:hypothetical protein
MFALRGCNSGEPLSYKGRILLHHDRRELEYLFPGQPVMMLNGFTPEAVAHEYGRPVMRLRDHPDMAAVECPLDPRRFVS